MQEIELPVREIGFPANYDSTSFFINVNPEFYSTKKV